MLVKTGKIVSIDSKRNNVNQEVVKDLEAMLKRAKEGEIVSFVAVEISNAQTFKNTLSANWESHCNNFIGVLSDIQYTMLKYQNGD